MNEQQKDSVQKILSVFETGKAEGDPSACALLTDGAGLSYGLFQGTDRSGTLDRIVLAYLDKRGLYADELRSSLHRFTGDETVMTPSTAMTVKNGVLVPPMSAVSIVAPQRRPTVPSWLGELMLLLHEIGTRDPVMRAAQEEVFETDYFLPAVAQGREMGLVLPLSYATIYDTAIQSGLSGISRIRKLFREVPPSRGGDEKTWTMAYLRARRNWLLTHQNPRVQQTVTRPNALYLIADTGNWDLDRPFTIGTIYKVTIS